MSMGAKMMVPVKKKFKKLLNVPKNIKYREIRRLRIAAPMKSFSLAQFFNHIVNSEPINLTTRG